MGGGTKKRKKEKKKELTRKQLIRRFIIWVAFFSAIYVTETHNIVTAVFSTLLGIVIGVLIFITPCALTAGLAYLKIRKVNGQLIDENEEIEVRNEDCRARNQNLVNQCAKLKQEIQGLQRQVVEAVNEMGYPPDYVCLDAVRFFIHALRNGRADDFRRLIDLYEDHSYHQQMVNGQRQLAGLMNQQIYNQQQMTQFLRYSNGLSAANLAAQIQTHAEVRALNDNVSNLAACIPAKS